jgi:hypothetical protein
MRSPKARSAKKQKAPRALSNVPALTAEAFNKTPGQKVVGGGNVLTIPANTGAGPFIVTHMLERTLDRRYAPVMVHHAALIDGDGTEFSMPAATSFVQKAAEAKLAVGDTFLIWRNDDYFARGKDCQSYAINITARASTKAKAKKKGSTPPM